MINFEFFCNCAPLSKRITFVRTTHISAVFPLSMTVLEFKIPTKMWQSNKWSNMNICNFNWDRVFKDLLPRSWYGSIMNQTFNENYVNWDLKADKFSTENKQKMSEQFKKKNSKLTIRHTSSLKTNVGPFFLVSVLRYSVASRPYFGISTCTAFFLTNNIYPSSSIILFLKNN